MLILSRKRGQSIIINGNIKVSVLKWNKFEVKLGITAPKEVVVDREEIAMKKKQTEQLQPVTSS